jgi:rhomboid protease GluP
MSSSPAGVQRDRCAECERSVLRPSEAATTTFSPPQSRARRRIPPVTTALIVINAAVYGVMVLRGVNPVTPTSAQLLDWGANWAPLSLSSQPWRILASNYLHGGIIHIAVNMWCLWSLGQLGEQIFDGLTYFLIYTVCGISGSLGSLWWHSFFGSPLAVGVGASGAIFGIAGALIAALYLGHLPVPKAALRGTLKSLVMFAVYNLFFGAAIGAIDNAAHIGGLVAGLALGAAMAKHLMTSREVRAAWRLRVFPVAAVVLAAGFFQVQKANSYAIQLENGMKAMQSGKLDESVKYLEQAHARRPSDRSTMLFLAGAYIQQENYANAVPLLEQAVKLDPNDAESQYNLGLAHEKLGNFDQAIPHLQKAAELDPKDTEAQDALKEAYAQKQFKANSVK